MQIESKKKKLCLEPLRGIITQGEKMADTVIFRLPATYGALVLSDLSWQIRAASEKNTLATTDLTASASGEFCLVQWEVSADFTAVSGALSLMLVGTDSEGDVVIKFPGDDPIWVRDAETGQYSPPEDAIQKALNGLQQAESTLEDATKALQEIGINFKILGHYGTLPELEAAVTNPSPGDAYGVGDPTVVYVWNGTSWAPLPGVFQPYPHTNLLVNPQFKYNSRGQSTYTGNVWTVDGWNGFTTDQIVTVNDSGISVVCSYSGQSTNTAAVQQEIPNATALAGKTVTLSVNVFSINSQGALLMIVYYVGESPIQYNNVAITSTGITKNTFTFPEGTNRIRIWIRAADARVGDASGTGMTLTAAKLELGSVSTLQAELDNPPPEDVEKLKLDMYSLDPGRCAYLPWHNENLLDNWYFVGGGSQQGGGQFPINQRGQTSYAPGGYGIDRWALQNVEASLNSDYVLLDFNQTGHCFFQKIERNLSGTHLTFSVLHSSNIRLTITITEGSKYNHLADKTLNVTSDISLSVVDADIPEISATQMLWVRIYSPEANYQIKVYATKLELGYLSTLARKDEEGNWVLNDPPPNFQQELAKCQRYCFNPIDPNVSGQKYIFQGIMTGDIYGIMPLPTTMRIRPSVEKFQAGTLRAFGVTSSGFKTDIEISALRIYNKMENGVIMRAVGESELLVLGNTYIIYTATPAETKIILSADL